jgi:hypothetical protein
MPTRLLALLLSTLLLGGACSRSAAGPTDPLPDSEVAADDAVRASGARGAARRFVEAYAQAPEAGVASLQPLVRTPLLRSWIHWLGVQNDELRGTLSGEVGDIQIGPAIAFEVDSVPGSSEILREVDVRGSVVFSVEPIGDVPFIVTRAFDGPMRLIREGDGSWSVLDFTRDQIPLSRQFERVKGAEAAGGDVTVTIACFFATPVWQFGLVVVNAGRAVSITRHGITLIDAEGDVVTTAQTVTRSLQRIPAGAAVEGLVTLPVRASADGLTLRIELAGRAGDDTVLEIPLDERIHPIASATSSPSTSASP